MKINNSNIGKFLTNPLSMFNDLEKEIKIPVNIEDLLKDLNIEVNLKSFPDSSILSETTKVFDSNYNMTFNVSINKILDPYVIRFLIAKQIAHRLCNDIDTFITDKILDLKRAAINPIQLRALIFAERLLLPKNLFSNELKATKEELYPKLLNHELGSERILNIICRLSKKFQVPITLVATRMSSLKSISKKTLNELYYAIDNSGKEDDFIDFDEMDESYKNIIDNLKEEINIYQGFLEGAIRVKNQSKDKKATYKELIASMVGSAMKSSNGSLNPETIANRAKEYLKRLKFI